MRGSALLVLLAARLAAADIAPPQPELSGDARQLVDAARSLEERAGRGCARPDALGACLVVTRVNTVCGATRWRLSSGRGDASGKALQATIAEVERLSPRGRAALASLAPGPERARLASALGQALVRGGDAVFEQMLTSPPAVAVPPRDTEEPLLRARLKQRAQDSMRATRQWVMTRMRAGQAATRQYEEAIALGDVRWASAAVARLGQLYQAFAADLLAIAPPAFRPPAGASADDANTQQRQFSDLFCDQLRSFAEPMEHKAREAYDRCLALPGASAGASAICAAGKAQLATP